MARRTGLKDLYVAKVTSNTTSAYTAETPVSLCRAISAKVTPKVNSENVYSDDSVEEIVSGFDSCEVEIEGGYLTPTMRALLFGHTFSEGFEVSSTDDLAQEVALGFRSKQSNGKYEFVWLYCGKFEVVGDEYETIADKTKVQSVSLKGTFYGRSKDNNYRIRVDESALLVGDTDATTAIGNWFSTVKEVV